MKRFPVINVAASAGLALAASLTAFAEGSITGDLGAGGTAFGDISRADAETDRIGIDLDAGSKLDVALSAGFAAAVEFRDPDGALVALGLPDSGKRQVKGFAVARTGHYEFVIASADGSQGSYKLVAKPTWDKKVVLTGTSAQSFDVPMPDGARIKGVVKPLPGASSPHVDAIMSPSGSKLAGPIVGNAGSAKIPSLTLSESGAYRLDLGASGGTGEFQCTITLKAPKPLLVSRDLRNGLTIVSFEGDGVDKIFMSECARCHDWARGYNGSRAYARQSLGRMRSGNMPKDAPRVRGDDIALVEEWIKTGLEK